MWVCELVNAFTGERTFSMRFLGTLSEAYHVYITVRMPWEGVVISKT
jgi:hypothetical protein